MNLVDNHRNDFGLRFSSSIYEDDYKATVIVNEMLPEFHYIYTVQNTVSEASKHVSIFAHTVSFVYTDSEYNYHHLWNIKHIDNIFKAGLIEEPISGGYIIEEHFISLMDEIIYNCLSFNGNDINNLSRFAAILHATSYISVPLALKYSSDDSFTDDMIVTLGEKLNVTKTLFDCEEDYEYVLKAIHELPTPYSKILLG